MLKQTKKKSVFTLTFFMGEQSAIDTLAYGKILNTHAYVLLISISYVL